MQKDRYYRKIGFIIGYFLFTTILFFIINLSREINYFIVMGITIVIVAIGLILTRLLK